MKDDTAGLRRCSEPLPRAVESRVVSPLWRVSMAFHSTGASAGFRAVRNPAVPVAWPCSGKISASRVTHPWEKTHGGKKTLSLKLRLHFVFSRNKWARWVLFSVSWYLCLCSQISRNGCYFLSVGRVKEHKIAQQCSVHRRVVEQRPACLPTFSSTSSVWNSLLEQKLIQESMLSALFPVGCT